MAQIVNVLYNIVDRIFIGRIPISKFGGDLAIGAMTIMSSIMQIVLLPLLGLSQGAQPIISYNYGAEKLERVKNAFKILIKSCLFYVSIMWILLLTVPQFFVMIFNNNEDLIKITS